jgi:hypothetical protein
LCPSEFKHSPGKKKSRCFACSFLRSHSPTQANNPFSDAQAVGYELSPVMPGQQRAAAGSSAGFARTQSDNSSSEASGIARGEVGAGYGPYAVSRIVVSLWSSAHWPTVHRSAKLPTRTATWPRKRPHRHPAHAATEQILLQRKRSIIRQRLQRKLHGPGRPSRGASGSWAIAGNDNDDGHGNGRVHVERQGRRDG